MNSTITMQHILLVYTNGVRLCDKQCNDGVGAVWKSVTKLFVLALLCCAFCAQTVCECTFTALCIYLDSCPW